MVKTKRKRSSSSKRSSTKRSSTKRSSTKRSSTKRSSKRSSKRSTKRSSKRSTKRSGSKRSGSKHKRGGEGTIERVRAERREALNKARTEKKDKAEAEMHLELRRLDSFLGKENTADSPQRPSSDSFGFRKTETPLGFPIEASPIKASPIKASPIKASTASMTKKLLSVENKIIALQKKINPFGKAKQLNKLNSTKKRIEQTLIGHAVNKGMGLGNKGIRMAYGPGHKWTKNPIYSSRSSTSTDVDE